MSTHMVKIYFDGAALLQVARDLLGEPNFRHTHGALRDRPNLS
jgi:hypothetical protein